MYSKLPYIIPVSYYDGSEQYPIFCVQAFRTDKTGYRAVYGYFKVHEAIGEVLISHAYKHDKSLPCPKYK